MQHATAQVIERNEESFELGIKRLFIEPPACSHCAAVTQSDVMTFNYRSFEYFEANGFTSVRFGLDHDALKDAAFQQVVIFMPKSKQELEFYIDLAQSVIAEDGEVYLVGEKKSGIASGAKRLVARASSADKIDSAKHCQLWEARGLERLPPLKLADYFDYIDVSVGDTSFKVASLPGVFAQGKFDEGTQLLLEQNIRRMKARTLDFGCGAGVIGAVLKLRNPDISIEAIDINWLALRATEETYRLNGIDGKVYASDGWKNVQGRVNGVVTNPPFHQGVSTEYETTEHFIRTAHSKMARYAPMYIVANNFLRYPTVIESVFGKCTYYAKSSKFNVYYCER